MRNQQVFAENIIQLGENQYDALCRVPTASGWVSDRKLDFYVEHRKRVDYNESEHLINKKAREYITKIIFFLSDANTITLPSINSEEFKGLTTTLKDLEDHIPVFRKMLLARRIALWLIFVEGFSIKRVYVFLNSGLLEVEQFVKMSKLTVDQLRARSANLINTSLCITVQTFPDDILLEERAWFLHDMGVNIDDLDTVLYQVQLHFNNALAQYSELYNLLKDEFDDHFIKHDKQQHLVIPSIGSVKRILSFIDQHINNLQALDLMYEILVKTLECLKYDKSAQAFMKPTILQTELLLKKIYNRKCGSNQYSYE